MALTFSLAYFDCFQVVRNLPLVLLVVKPLLEDHCLGLEFACEDFDVAVAAFVAYNCVVVAAGVDQLGQLAFPC